MDPDVRQELDGLNTLIKDVREDLKRLDEARERLRRTSPPIGSIVFMATDKVPDGYLLCDGRQLNRDEFRILFDIIGTTWGAGDGSTTFNLPDLRGVFPRFLDAEAGRDAGRSLGTLQEDATRMARAVFHAVNAGGHSHAMSAEGSHAHAMHPGGVHSHAMYPAGVHNHGNGPFDRLLKMDGRNTVETWDNTTGEPNLMRSEPIMSAGDHAHALYDCAPHYHGMDTSGNHTHQVQNNGDHSHSLAGGDTETRPINQALAGFIRF